MSIQNITLFYWGQNRLVNILPLLTSFIKDPGINLYAVLFITAFTHYLLLFLFSWITVKILTKKNIQYLDLKVFIAITLIFLLVFNANSIFSISIAHIEYSLPWLLVIFVFCRGIFVKDNWYILSTYMIISIVIAMGINNSIVLLSFGLIFGYFILTRSLSKNICAFGAVSALSFLAWGMISRTYGNTLNYSTFSIANQPSAMLSVIHNVLGDFNLFNLIIILAVLLIWHIYIEACPRNQDLSATSKSFLILSIMVVFCLLWLLFFSSIKWVEINVYSSRYFTPIIYGLLLFFALQCTRFFIIIGKRSSFFVTAIAFLSIVAMLLNGGFVSLSNYDIFQKTNIDSKRYNLFAGDYWLVWPSVLHNLMSGTPAFGLCYRGDGNKEEVKYFIDQQLKIKGQYSVLCLKNEVNTCKDQISSIIGEAYIDQIIPHSIDANELILTNRPTNLKFFDKSFVTLPSTTTKTKENGNRR